MILVGEMRDFETIGAALTAAETGHLVFATPAIKNLIREGKTYQIQSVLQTNTAMGMMTMDQALKNLYERGIISYEDAIDHAFDPKELQRLLGRLS